MKSAFNRSMLACAAILAIWGIEHAVTLGARSLQKDERGQIQKGGKRHPTVEDDVTIYPGATILGGETVIGAGSTIGGNVFLVQSVPPDSLVYYEEKQLRIVPKKRRKAADLTNEFMADPT